jgi:hypothetical protein
MGAHIGPWEATCPSAGSSSTLIWALIAIGSVVAFALMLRGSG